MTVEKANNVLITGASVIDGSGADPAIASVLIEGNRITAVGELADCLSRDIPGVSIIDASNHTVMPGLVDAHCHISFDQPTSNDELFFHRREGLAAIIASINAQKVLRAGVTSIMDPDCIFDVSVDLRDAIEAGVVEGPRMTVGGKALITCVGGAAGRLLPDRGRLGYAVITQTPAEIVTEVRRQVKSGVDWIKVHVSGLPIRGKSAGEIQAWSVDELRLVCDTAHNLGVSVVGHCRSAASTRDAAVAGFDMIVHATFMDESSLEAVVNANVCLVPALTFQANLADFGEQVGADKYLQQVFRNELAASTRMLRRAYDAGVPLLTGSESGFSITPYGDWHYRELEVFVDYMELTPVQAIQCATENGALAFGMQGQAGCIKKGYIADLIIVSGDPSTDVSILGQKSAISAVFKDGRQIITTTVLPETWSPPGWRVTKFSDSVLTSDAIYNK